MVAMDRKIRGDYTGRELCKMLIFGCCSKCSACVCVRDG